MGPTQIMAVDLSMRSTGVASFDCVTGTRLWRTVKSEKKLSQQPWERQSEIVSSVAAFPPLMAHDDLAFIEGYAFGATRQVSNVSTLSEIGGLLKHRFWQMTSVYPVSVPPATIKMFLTGKGNSKKEEMILPAFRKYGVEFANSDELDAYVLLDLALCSLGLCERKLNLKEIQAVKTVQSSLKERGLL